MSMTTNQTLRNHGGPLDWGGTGPQFHFHDGINFVSPFAANQSSGPPPSRAGALKLVLICWLVLLARGNLYTGTDGCSHERMVH